MVWWTKSNFLGLKPHYRICNHCVNPMVLITCEWVPFATLPCPRVPIEGFWSLFCRPMSLLPIFWQSTWDHRCGGGCAKLDKGCKSVHAIQKIVSDLSLLAACFYEITTAFPDIEKPSQLSARSRFRSCRHNVAFPNQLKGWNWKTILHLCALQLVSKVCAT